MNIQRILLLVISIVAILVALALVFWGFRELSGGKNDGNGELINDGFGIASFEECEQAGYPVMESFPRQCTTPDGTVFTEGGGVEPGSPNEGGNEQGLQTPAGPLFLSYENGYMRLRGTLQRNDACVNWVVRGEASSQVGVTFRVDPERRGDLCAQVISHQQVDSLVRASEGSNVTVIFEGDMVIYTGPVSQ